MSILGGKLPPPVEIIMGIKVDFAILKFCASATIISFLSTNNSHRYILLDIFQNRSRNYTEKAGKMAITVVSG